jgi:hypothetical protein
VHADDALTAEVRPTLIDGAMIAREHPSEAAAAIDH